LGRQLVGMTGFEKLAGTFVGVVFLKLEFHQLTGLLTKFFSNVKDSRVILQSGRLDSNYVCEVLLINWLQTLGKPVH
jgi:hypothetical protein